MIEEVEKEMVVFFIIYLISHLAFAEGFFFISMASIDSKMQFTMTYGEAIGYSFFTALGAFNYQPHFEDNRNPMKYIGMFLLMLSCIITMVVMLNLLISIIQDRYNIVAAQATIYMYKEQANLIA